MHARDIARLRENERAEIVELSHRWIGGTIRPTTRQKSATKSDGLAQLASTAAGA